MTILKSKFKQYDEIHPSGENFIKISNLNNQNTGVDVRRACSRIVHMDLRKCQSIFQCQGKAMLKKSKGLNESYYRYILERGVKISFFHRLSPAFSKVRCRSPSVMEDGPRKIEERDDVNSNTPPMGDNMGPLLAKQN